MASHLRTASTWLHCSGLGSTGTDIQTQSVATTSAWCRTPEGTRAVGSLRGGSSRGSHPEGQERAEGHGQAKVRDSKQSPGWRRKREQAQRRKRRCAGWGSTRPSSRASPSQGLREAATGEVVRSWTPRPAWAAWSPPQAWHTAAAPGDTPAAEVITPRLGRAGLHPHSAAQPACGSGANTDPGSLLHTRPGGPSLTVLTVRTLSIRTLQSREDCGPQHRPERPSLTPGERALELGTRSVPSHPRATVSTRAGH